MMYGAPPAPSKDQLALQERMAQAEVSFALGLCAILYISPHAIEYFTKLF
ncbi:hypothetical protein P152DRAFT_475947 [Eremomyces bilateralis CBS 781.70]|uniref:Mitochondrial outer membrane translocase complex, subunit Tom5 n=1 Tax=Eremomyces bilateralis CBS 781.70 TaxID=1392243 RepID=A0A6G1FWM4_9PEZI|nr:uncharacterized protein P152DRAFT_475947 [Eremomyces bilateralis CBS 781.70]KAF1810102.1 hypothetical protein P152DRAFT_475947 [Eremomyces bilateralis CBS 781.70]